jgi:hypothetical protein
MEAQFQLRELLLPPRSLTFRLVCIMKMLLSFRGSEASASCFGALGNIALFLSIDENRFITDLACHKHKGREQGSARRL